MQKQNISVLDQKLEEEMDPENNHHSTAEEQTRHHDNNPHADPAVKPEKKVAQIDKVHVDAADASA